MAFTDVTNKFKSQQRFFQDSWEVDFLIIKSSVSDIAECLVCGVKLCCKKKYNFQRHYKVKHEAMYSGIQGTERMLLVQRLKSAKHLGSSSVDSKFSSVSYYLFSLESDEMSLC